MAHQGMINNLFEPEDIKEEANEVLEMFKNKLINLSDVLTILCDEEYISNKEIVSSRKPTHGTCCTCQKCGYSYDDCVCEDNQLIQKLLGKSFLDDKSAEEELMKEYNDKTKQFRNIERTASLIKKI